MDAASQHGQSGLPGRENQKTDQVGGDCRNKIGFSTTGVHPASLLLKVNIGANC
jgi:hypothetical protein